MRDSDNTGPTNIREPQHPAVPVMLYAAIVMSTIGTAFLAGGIGMIGATADRVGPYAAYGVGLTLVAMAASMTVGIGALICHRIILLDNAKTRADIARLRTEVANGIRTLRGEVSAAHEENSQEHKAILAVEKNTANRIADQLTPRRNSS